MVRHVLWSLELSLRLSLGARTGSRHLESQQQQLLWQCRGTGVFQYIGKGHCPWVSVGYGYCPRTENGEGQRPHVDNGKGRCLP